MEVSSTTFELAVAVCFCNCYFNFNLRNPRNGYTAVSQYQHHRKKNYNRKILHHVDQPLADLDLEKQRGEVIQWRAGERINYYKRDENTIITCQRSTDKHKQLLLLQENTQKGCQSSPWQQKLLVLSHVSPNLDLSIWSISQTWVIFSVFSGLLG